ncbi:unnamed protein product [Blepharisma stoltei]|uniref:MORN repeat protein n=1 Tax=Blepharisma stoltei TaxID=1481888 RepID=A0AAU9JA43_9CILI|nr:unnamed protein product [Blepharisma stoltei]
MGNVSGICSKPAPKFIEEQVSLYESADLDRLTMKFDEITQNPSIADLENEFGPFQFEYNYYIEIERGFNRVECNYEDNNQVMRYISEGPLLGKDEKGTWIYIGECLINSKVRDGRGYLVYIEEKSKFQGYFKDDKINGRGRLCSPEKILEGDWYDGRLYGEGKEKSRDKSSYKGSYKDGLYDGLGKSEHSDGSEYSGEFLRGERHGYGEYNWNDGSVYQGDWREGKFHGIGKYTDSMGNIYEGGWKDNRMNGYGEYAWADGRKYRGNYVDDKKHGYGEFYWPDGQVCRGNWINGKQHGKGEYRNNGNNKVGTWHHGVFVSWD